MTTRAPRDRGDAALLATITVADDADAWTAAGFTVADHKVVIGATTIVLGGGTDRASQGTTFRGITSWGIAGLDIVDGHIDGLPTTVAAQPDHPDTATHAAHANGATHIDHVVVLTPDLDRTCAAFTDLGLTVRRVRETTSYSSPMRQAFLRLGSTVLEVVSGDAGTGLPEDRSPAAWFGLAVDVTDLDAVAGLLPEGLGAIKEAVQPGRRIATVRGKALGLSIPLALMDTSKAPVGAGATVGG